MTMYNGRLLFSVLVGLSKLYCKTRISGDVVMLDGLYQCTVLPSLLLKSEAIQLFLLSDIWIYARLLQIQEEIHPSYRFQLDGWKSDWMMAHKQLVIPRRYDMLNYLLLVHPSYFMIVSFGAPIEAKGIHIDY
jgi:hypothetical protein